MNLDARKEERLNAALTSIGDASPRKRLGGIVALRSFFKEGDALKNSQALLTLSHMIALEDDPAIKNGIIEVFKSPEIKYVDSSILKEILISLLNLDRDMVKRGDLETFRFYKENIQTVKDTLHERAKTIAFAIVELLKKGVIEKDLSGLYCDGCDFKNLSLKNIDFTNSILINSDFSEATCINCSTKPT